MCKNMMIAGLKPENEKKLWKWLIAATPFMSANDKDGIGLAAMSNDGIWGERWLYPKDAFKYRKTFNASDQAILNDFKGVLEGTARYNKFGTVQTPFAVLFHTRMATCEINMDNTHPFVSESGTTALIHNGVVRSETVKTQTSTCDSELILRSYLNNAVNEDTVGIHSVAMDINGSYACGVLAYDKEGNPVLDIFKNSSSLLCAAYVKELDAIVFCTNEAIIKATCKALKWHMSNAFTFSDNTLARIDARTGKLISKHSFKPSENGYNWGRTVTDMEGLIERYEGYRGHKYGYGD